MCLHLNAHNFLVAGKHLPSDDDWDLRKSQACQCLKSLDFNVFLKTFKKLGTYFQSNFHENILEAGNSKCMHVYILFFDYLAKQELFETISNQKGKLSRKRLEPVK